MSTSSRISTAGPTESSDQTALPRAIMPEDSLHYDNHRKLHNQAISNYPSRIFLPENVHQVQKLIQTIRAQNPTAAFSIKAGGHSNTGFSVVDNAVLIDLSHMKRIVVHDQHVEVEAGCLWSEVYSALEPYEKLVAGGNMADVGVAGLTLGGGYSIFSPLYGLALDNVIEFEVVDFNGNIIEANERSHTDLFWALRGAGQGSFGCVTKLTFKLHKPPSYKFYRACLEFNEAQLVNVLTQYEEFHLKHATRETSASVFCIVSASNPVHVVLDIAYLGDPSLGRSAFDPFFKIPGCNITIEHTITPVEFSRAKMAQTKRGANTKRGGFLKSLDEDTIEMIQKFIKSARAALKQEDAAAATAGSSSGACASFYFEYWHGEFSTVPKTATAFPHRKKRQLQIIIGSYAPTASEEINLRPWVSDSFHQLNHQGDMFGGHTNTPVSGLTDWFRFYWKDRNYTRLRAIKSKYDPENVFRHPHSVRPEPPPQPENNEPEDDPPPSRWLQSKM